MHAVLTAADVPGENDTGPIIHDEPLLPADDVRFYGQAVAWVVADDETIAQRAAKVVKVDYQALPARLTVAQAIAEQAFHLPPAHVIRGDVDRALLDAPHRLAGELDVGGQDHFYLETQASWAQIDSEGIVQVMSSTQHPTETQIIVARVLGIPLDGVAVSAEGRLDLRGFFGVAAAALVAMRTPNAPLLLGLRTGILARGSSRNLHVRHACHLRSLGRPDEPQARAGAVPIVSQRPPAARDARRGLLADPVHR